MSKNKEATDEKESFESSRRAIDASRIDTAYHIIDEYAKFLLPRAEEHLRQRIFVHMPIPMFELNKHVEKCFTVAAAVIWTNKNIAYIGKELREGYWYIAPLDNPFCILCKNEGQVDLSQPLELAFYYCRETNFSKLVSLQSEPEYVQKVIREYISQAAYTIFGQQKESVLIDHSFTWLLKYNIDYSLVSTTIMDEPYHLQFVNSVMDALDRWLKSASIRLVTRTSTKKVRGSYKVYFKFIADPEQ